MFMVFLFQFNFLFNLFTRRLTFLTKAKTLKQDTLKKLLIHMIHGKNTYRDFKNKIKFLFVFPSHQSPTVTHPYFNTCHSPHPSILTIIIKFKNVQCCIVQPGNEKNVHHFPDEFPSGYITTHNNCDAKKFTPV